MVRQCHVLRWGLSSQNNSWKAGWRFTRVTSLKNMVAARGHRWKRDVVVCSSPCVEPARFSSFLHMPLPPSYWKTMGIGRTALVVESDCLRFFRFLALLHLVLSSSCPCHILCLKTALESLSALLLSDLNMADDWPFWDSQGGQEWARGILERALGRGQAEPAAKLYLAASASCTNLIFFLALNLSAVWVWRWLVHNKYYMSGQEAE